MRLTEFAYKRARDLEEAFTLYGHFEEKAFFLAGGTDLVPRLKLRMQKPAALIDLKGVKELQGIKRKEGFVRIGSLVKLYDLKRTQDIRASFPALWEALEVTSCETLQMRGTLGGNLLQETRCLFYNQSRFWRNAADDCLKMGGDKCNAIGGQVCFSNYCSDMAPALLSLEGQVSLVGPQGERQIPLHELYTGNGERPFRILPGEIMTEIIIPDQRTRGAYEKLSLRRSIDYPLLGVAFSAVGKTGRLSVGAVGPRPFFYAVDRSSEEAIEQRAEHASEHSTPVTNTVLPPLYRKRMVKVIAMRLMRKVLQGE